MIESLPLFHRLAGKPVVVLGTGDPAEAKRRLVMRAGGVVVDDLRQGIETGARLAFITHQDETAARVDARRAREAGLLVNVTDRPELCDFTVPSILDRAPVIVAVGTGGVSAGLAKQIRLRLEALLPQRLGALARALGLARGRLRERFPDGGERRRALDSALAAGGPLDPLDEGSAGRVDEWLAGGAASPAGLVEIVLRSQEPDDLTLREARLLGTADRLWYEAAVSPEVLNRARADASRHVLDAAGAIGAAPEMAPGALTLVLRAPR